MTKKKTYSKAFKTLSKAIQANIAVQDAFVAAYMAKADSAQHDLNNACTDTEETHATNERDTAIYQAEKHLLTLRRLETLRGMFDAFRADFNRFIK